MDFFFDAHFHPTLKKHFANPNEQPQSGLRMLNPWRTANRKDFLKGFNALSLAKCLIKPFVESSLVSQSSLAQLSDNNYKLAIVALFCPDKGLLELITKNDAFMSIVQKGRFGDVLVKSQFDDLSINATTKPFAVVQKDLELLMLPDETGKVVTKLQSSQFAPGNAPAVVFSVEGLHCLRSDLNHTDRQAIVSDILTNLSTLLNSGNKVILINVAHIDDSNAIFANQAYAVDGFREGGFTENHLRPTGNGLTALGQQIAKELYNREVLPDVKHMSWLARKQFYAFRDAEGITAPIVCSHAGFTGCWFNKHGESISDFILPDLDANRFVGTGQHRLLLAKPNPYLQDNTIGFNVSTINLFNEDIEAILASDGLIGISLDQRILGYSEFTDTDTFVSKNIATINDQFKLITDSDFISDAEFAQEPLFSRTSQRFDKIARCVRTDARTTGNSTDVKDFFHPRHFYLQIAHAIEVARFIEGEGGAEKMLTQTLCIGSDFDGLIDGLDCCPDTTQISHFKKRFVNQFGGFLNEAGIALPVGLSVQTVANRIFYENGRDFVLRRLDVV